MAIRLVESFLSIQGEGKYQGRLAIFLRFFGCNLNCSGFGVSKISPKTGEQLLGCDTIRAVQTAHFEASEFKDHENILSLVLQKCDELAQKPMIVITGGEPLLWHKNEIFISLIAALLERGFFVQFETNGTILVDFSKFELYKKCSFALSVKLANSGESEARRIKKDAIRAICANAKDSFFKFVSTGEAGELAQIKQIAAIVPSEVWCMPLGADAAQLEQNAKKVAQFCIQNGFCYSDRLHIRLWGDKEGV